MINKYLLFYKKQSFTTRGLLKRDQSYFEKKFCSNDNSIHGIKVPFIPGSCTVAEQQNDTQGKRRHDNALDSELKSKRIKRLIFSLELLFSYMISLLMWRMRSQIKNLAHIIKIIFLATCRTSIIKYKFIKTHGCI